MTTATIEPLLTRRDVAEWLQVSLRTVDRLMRDPDPKKRLPYFVVGRGLVRFERHRVEAWKNTEQEGSVPPRTNRGPRVRNSRFR